MQLDEKSRDILHSIERNDGRATTTEIRRETGLSNSAVRYRYDKLIDAGLITLDEDDSLTPDGVAAVKVAVLSEDGYAAIDKGITVEQKQQRAEVEPSDNYERIKDLENELTAVKEENRELRGELDEMEEKIEMAWFMGRVNREYLAGFDSVPSEEALNAETTEKFKN